MRLFILAASGLVAVVIGSSVALGGDPTADDVRAQFANITPAEAEAMGYLEETPCIDASELPPSVLEQLNISASAGMGVHYINEALVDKTLDPLQPEAIQFGPGGEIWGVEYLTPPQEEPLSLLGQTLTFVEEVELDALHLWVIDNPNGQFADFNPAVSCAAGEEVTADDVNAAFADITQAEAEAMGYLEETPCIDASELPSFVLEQLNISASAGMGVHFINEALIDKTLDPMEPEAIQFGPGGEIWGVEYLTPPQEEPLSLLGQTLTFVEEVELDALHLWVIDNPNGQFADFNPAVSCATGAPETGTGPDSASGGRGAAPIVLALLAAIAGGALLAGGWTLRVRASR